MKDLPEALKFILNIAKNICNHHCYFPVLVFAYNSIPSLCIHMGHCIFKIRLIVAILFQFCMQIENMIFSFMLEKTAEGILKISI